MGENKEEDDEGIITCCHRMTICPRLLRQIPVTRPIFRSIGERFTWSKLFESATYALIASMTWAVLYFLLGDTMLPKNDGFGLFTLAIFSSWLGSRLSSIPYLNLPPVFGMLIAGLIVRNSGLYDIHEELGPSTTSKIRTFCLTFIIIRAGLQLSTTTLKDHPIFLMLLSVVPSTVEMLVLAVCCKLILSYHWDWAFMAGTMLACMSPVVTVNCILALVERGYAEDKGLATILCTATCIDDIHIVSLFAICYSIVFTNDKGRTDWWCYVPVGLRDAILGVTVGVLLGVCFAFLPHRSHKYASWFRMICLVLGSLMCTTATAKLTVSGGGYLASLVLSFVAMIGWKILSLSFDTTPFRRAAYVLWKFVQPILVGIIGADIDLRDWIPSRSGLHLVCVLIGLAARSVAVYLTTLRSSFTWRERLFVVVCWIPKGTLQAALGPMAYEQVRYQRENREQVEMALDILRLSVITILFLAPIGASLITIGGPLLLEQVTDEERRRDRELSYLKLVSFLPTPPDDVKVKPLPTNP
ncbi:PREDICTED: sodium/hydrogen exchanger 9B1-like [Habropoda laboriosa]|uniref:sodium/hydrogen exchanger 9B1-like n=1 Tax=Habropoda laboriosa TaxID=597456 RepID=UPI00083D084D|nr:PREDICTED: sodium/hydrogen exchanger 9B1-like [Habropoda laboriosa]